MVVGYTKNKIAENYIILLLGVKNEPILSSWHLQKEMFMLSKASPTIAKYFEFKQHYNGPYDQHLDEIVKEPLQYDGAWEIKKSQISLTYSGKRIFDTLKKENGGNKKFVELLKTIKLVRIMYDRLSNNELLFLIYQTYPTYAVHSNIYETLVVDKNKREELANALLRKGIVTEKRYEELLKIGQ